MINWLRRRSDNGQNEQVRIKTFQSTGGDGAETQKNEYLIYNAKEAATIDADHAIDEMFAFLQAQQLDLKWILATHGHLSHVRAVSRLKAATGAAFGLHLWDSELYAEQLPTLTIDRRLEDNDILTIGAAAIKALHTPGHTKGSMCFWSQSARAVFTGSSLLKGGNGEIWGPKSMSLMLFSLKRINYTLPMATKVYPGEGETTTLQQESWMNCLRSA